MSFWKFRSATPPAASSRCTTSAIAAINCRNKSLTDSLRRRANRARSGKPPTKASYTAMRAEQVEITASCPAFGEIVSRGTLVADDGRTLAGFRQTTQLWAGSRVINLEVELTPWKSPAPILGTRIAHCALRGRWRRPSCCAAWDSCAQRTSASRLEAPSTSISKASAATSRCSPAACPIIAAMPSACSIVCWWCAASAQRRFRMGIGVEPAAARQCGSGVADAAGRCIATTVRPARRHPDGFFTLTPRTSWPRIGSR